MEPNESFYDAAAREVREETGLEVCNLQYRGVANFCDKENGDRSLVFLYKTFEYRGVLMAKSDEGEHFWCSLDKLFATPREKFTKQKYPICLSPLFYEDAHKEVFISGQVGEAFWGAVFR